MVPVGCGDWLGGGVAEEVSDALGIGSPGAGGAGVVGGDEGTAVGAECDCARRVGCVGRVRDPADLSYALEHRTGLPPALCCRYSRPVLPVLWDCAYLWSRVDTASVAEARLVKLEIQPFVGQMDVDVRGKDLAVGLQVGNVDIVGARRNCAGAIVKLCCLPGLSIAPRSQKSESRLPARAPRLCCWCRGRIGRRRCMGRSPGLRLSPDLPSRG